MVRSPYAHAKIKSIDTSMAERMAGVKAIHAVRKAGDEVYFAGEEVLALAADTEEHALDAARAVKVDYEVLEFLVKEEDALNLKDDKGTVPGANKKNRRPPTTGESDKFADGMKKAEAVSEGSYGMPVICHQCLEPHGLVAEWGADGSLTVWASTQAVFGTARALAGYFRGRGVDLPENKVKCITHYMGGGYGSKFGPDVQGTVAAELARKAKAPVKLMLDRASEVTVGGNRPSAFGKVKVGGMKDGTVTAFQVEAWGTPGIGGGVSTVGPLPYVYPFQTKRTFTMLRLNTQAQRAMRAPGHPQSCYLTDCALDDFAAKIGMDPMLVRLKNLPENDANAVKNNPLSLNALRHTIYTKEIEIAAGLSKWKDKWRPPGTDKGPLKRGIGMALHTWGGQASGQANECTVTIAADGSATARTSTQDLGTAQRTVTGIVVAEILGLQPEQVALQIGESDFGASTGSGGSTTCPSQAPAALRAATAARDDLFAKIAGKLGSKAEDLEIEAGKVRDKARDKTWDWKQACSRLGTDQAKGRGVWTAAEAAKPENKGVSNGGVCGVQVAEVLVDTETGLVRCTQVVAVQDCGLVVDALTCESQVAGGVIMGVNYALFEERVMDRATGRQVNPNMEFYKLGGLQDMPKVVVHLHDMPERGVIGVGEPPTISTHAAIGNAIMNAIGVRVPYTPFSPDRVLAALAAKGGKEK